MNTSLNLFDAELRQNIAKTIKRLRAGGTVAMSVANLRQVTPTPKTHDGAPLGTNAPYYYAQRFEEIVKSESAFVRFTTMSGGAK